MKRYLHFLVFLTLFNCDDDENKNRHRVLGDYEGSIEYFDDTFPGHTNPQPVTFTVKEYGLNNILIRVDYELSIPVTKSFTSEVGNQIITLGFNKAIKHSSDGITIECGDAELNDWGNMCGYFNETSGMLYLIYTWTNGSGNNGAIIRAERIE